MQDIKIADISKCNIINVDGTFNVAPAGFYQLLVIHGHKYDRNYPLEYALMRRKTISHTRVFINEYLSSFFTSVYDLRYATCTTKKN